MAANGLNINHTNFSCSICLDLMKDPVSIPCGHSYCMSCINTHWDGEVGKQSYSCPQCRHSFTPRPGLVKNTMLAALMEELKKSGKKRGVPAAHLSPSAAHGHVFCDLCSGTKVKAEKSCLQCLVSYCKEHLQPHFDVPALKKHKLVEPTGNLHENMCSVHNELMKMFCRTDQQCICYLCSVDQHKGHHTVTAAAERTVKERELQTFHQNILQRIEHKEKDLDGLQHHLKNSSRSADAAVENSERSLKELCHLLETKMTFVKQQIRSKQSLKALLQLLDERMSFVKQQVRSLQETEEHRVKELQDKVQQEISELKRKLSELDTLSHTEDHVHFLHKFASLSKVSETSESVNSSQSPPPFQDMVTAAVAKLRRSLQETSLLDPPAVSNKPQVNTAKTDALPAGAQGTAAAQQRQKQLHPLQDNGPPPQSSEEDEQSQSSEEDEQSQNSEEDEQSQSSEEDEQSQNSEEDETQNYDDQWPALPHRNLKLKTAHNLQVQPVQPISGFSFQQSDVSIFKSERDLRKYGRNLTWDLWSVNDRMELCNENICVKRNGHRQKSYISHPARFTNVPQVVSKESLAGCRFWQVNALYQDVFTVAVTYKDIRRDGYSAECCFGMNAKSWALECSHSHSVFWHNGNKVEIPIGATSVGVFLDYKAGLLSFYRMGYSFCHIHTVKTSFTQPLFAGLRLDDVDSKAELPRRSFY